MQAPDVMRSVCLAFNLVATALGGYFSAFLMSLVTNYTTWLDNLGDPDTSHLDQYFFLLAAFMLVNTIAFVGVAYGYKYKVVRHRAPLPLVGGQQRHAVRQAPLAEGTPSSTCVCATSRHATRNAVICDLHHVSECMKCCLFVSRDLFLHLVCVLLQHHVSAALSVSSSHKIA